MRLLTFPVAIMEEISMMGQVDGLDDVRLKTTGLLAGVEQHSLAVIQCSKSRTLCLKEIRPQLAALLLFPACVLAVATCLLRRTLPRLDLISGTKGRVVEELLVLSIG